MLQAHPELVALAKTAAGYFADQLAPSTRHLYAGDWQRFADWCAAYGMTALPADVGTVALYITAIAKQERSLSTIKHHLAAIKAKHEDAGYPSSPASPIIKRIIQGISRQHGRPARSAQALLPETLRQVVQAIDETTLIGKRDKALLLLGFAGAFRRSELVGLNMEDLQWYDAGVIVQLGHTKTDQHGQGRLVGIPRGAHPETCPVLALETWLLAAHLDTGAIFRGMDGKDRLISPRLSGRAVSLIIKRHLTAVGLDTTRYSGHSLRAGHCTAAVRAGVHAKLIMQQSGHRSHGMMLKYIRLGSIFSENSANAINV